MRGKGSSSNSCFFVSDSDPDPDPDDTEDVPEIDLDPDDDEDEDMDLFDCNKDSGPDGEDEGGGDEDMPAAIGRGATLTPPDCSCLLALPSYPERSWLAWLLLPVDSTRDFTWEGRCPLLGCCC